MHQLLKESELFKSHGIKMIFVYESPESTMKEYLGDAAYPFHFVADPKNTLYNIYGVERSFLKVMKSLFHGIMGKVQQGSKLFRQPMKQDGHVDRIPAEFIIDETGRISLARYGKFVGDHLPIDELKKAVA